jgi:Transcription factor WhiB
VADIVRLPGAQLDYWEWQGQAACRGMDSSMFFHPPKERNREREQRVAAAKAICQRTSARRFLVSARCGIPRVESTWTMHRETPVDLILGRWCRHP